MNGSVSGGNIRKGGHHQWHKDGLRFECQRCGGCCGGAPGVVWLSKKEIKDISAYLGISQEQFAENYLRIINGRASLLEYGNGDCVMYDNGCKIYENRPRQCKTFPFWKSNLMKRAEWEEQKKTCPGIDKGKLYSSSEIEDRLRPELSDL